MNKLIIAMEANAPRCLSLPISRMTTENPDNANNANCSRLPLIDALKAIASQLIVIHHLAFYGPMSDYALPLAPKLIPWLYDYARIAV